jgi:hypothetical protein
MYEFQSTLLKAKVTKYFIFCVWLTTYYNNDIKLLCVGRLLGLGFP